MVVSNRNLLFQGSIFRGKLLVSGSVASDLELLPLKFRQRPPWIHVSKCFPSLAAVSAPLGIYRGFFASVTCLKESKKAGIVRYSICLVLPDTQWDWSNFTQIWEDFGS